MAKRLTVYLQDDIAAIIDTRSVEARKVSPTVSELLGRYDEMCRRNIPTNITTTEWQELAVCLKKWSHAEALTLEAALKLYVQRNCANEALVKKIEVMSYVEVVACVDVVERFWSARERGDHATLPTGVSSSLQVAGEK